MESGETRIGVVWPTLPTTKSPLPLPGLPRTSATLSSSASPLVLAGGSLCAVEEDAVVPHHQQWQGALLDLAKDEKGLLVVDTEGKLLRIIKGDDKPFEEEHGISGGVVSVAATLQHCLALGPTGALYCKGVPPLLGNTSPSPEFVRVSLLEGLEVVQLVVGEDFSVVLARKRDLGVVTPEERKIADEPEELCPLGLQLGVPAAEDTDDLKSESCDKLKTALGHNGGIKAHIQVESENDGEAAHFGREIKRANTEHEEGETENTKAACADSEEPSVMSNFVQETLEESYKQMALHSGEEAADYKVADGVQSSDEDPYTDESKNSEKQEDAQQEKSRRSNLAEICASVTSNASLDSLGYVAGVGRSIYSSLTRTPTSSLTSPPSSLQSSRSPSRTPSLSSSRGSTPSLSRHSEALNQMRESGERLGGTLVFCWGQARRGQLGQGDMLVRPSPSLVTLPPLTTITKITAGARHVLALTACGEIWGWGDNSKGQLGPGMAALLNPTLVSLPKGETARDVSCCNQASLIVMGSGRFLLLGTPGNASSGARLQVLVPPLDPGLTPISGVLLSSGGVAATLANQHPATLGLVQAEQTLLRSTQAVFSVLQALVPKGSDESALVKVRTLIGTLHSVLLGCVLSTSSSQSISSICTSLESAPRTGVLSSLPPLAAAFSALQGAVSNCVAMDCLLLESEQQHVMPNIVEVINQCSLRIVHAIVQVLGKEFGVTGAAVKGQAAFEQLLSEHSRSISAFLATVMKASVAGAQLDEQVAQLTSLVRSQEKKWADATKTREFWRSLPRLSPLRSPERRIILDSRVQPISLAGLFSKHWLLLLTDMLVDVGYSYSASSHSLSTAWIEVTSSPRQELTLALPEETLTLVAPDANGRRIWHKALSQAIMASLGRHQTSENTQPPITRHATYTFTKGCLRGARYEGIWSQGKPNGKGKMEYPDGWVHEGYWRNGERHGRGRAAGPAGNVQEGSWVRGRLEGRGKLVDESGEYEGGLEDGRPHGHGIRREGKFMESGASLYIGDWVRGVRQGYGVQEDIMGGEKYMGDWECGVRQGKGCVVTSDGIYYQGAFLGGKLTGPGLMVFEDGAHYRGEFASAGEFCGKGVLVAGGRRYQGTFQGNYSDKMNFSGEMTSVEDIPTFSVISRNSVKELSDKRGPEESTKWASVFQAFHTTAGLSLGNRGAWDQLAIALHQAKVDAKEHGRSIELGNGLETIPKFGQEPGSLSSSELSEIELYLAQACASPLHPLHWLVSNLVEAYNVSYGGVRSHPTLLPHAMEELESITTRLYKVIKVLFPGLPSATAPTRLQIGLSEEVRTATPSSILHPLLLPSLHPTVFTMFAQREARQDAIYWERILRWNKHSDSMLLTFLDVDSQFVLEEGPRQRDRHFLEAIHTLQQLKTTFTPVQKLAVVGDMFKAITESREGVTWSMDTLLPVCMYVVVRARVLQLGAELAMLQELMEDFLFQGEQGIMLTTLLAAYHQMLKESLFIN